MSHLTDADDSNSCLRLPALPCLTDNLPGIGGLIKHVPQDFVVEEVPAYMPCGTGDHLFLWIEKRDTSAEQLTRHCAQVLGVKPSEIGVAGLKDRQAVTRQYISVPIRSAPETARLETEQIRVLEATPHRNKLRTGHTRGNRFSILVRDVCHDALGRAQAVAEQIQIAGFPNYFGSQRFGVNGETAMMGFELLRGTMQPTTLRPNRQKFLLRLALSAAQSALFNHFLVRRISEGLLHRVLRGDVMQVVESGGCFVADDLDAEQPRYDVRQTVVTGPIFGPKMKQPGGEPLNWEAAILELYNLNGGHFRRFPKLTSGTRRPLLVQPTELSIDEEPEGLRFQFRLPSGTYATTLMREFMKNDPEAIRSR